MMSHFDQAIVCIYECHAAMYGKINLFFTLSMSEFQTIQCKNITYGIETNGLRKKVMEKQK